MLLDPCRTCDGAFAAAALGCKEFSKTGHAVGIIIPGGELLPCQGRLAPRADQAFSMPGLVTVGHAALRQRLWGQHRSAGGRGDPHPGTEPGSLPPPPALPPPCCSEHSEGQTCSHNRGRSSEHPCLARRNGSREAVHSRCTGSNARAMSGLHIPASGTLWGTGVPLRGWVPSS